MDEIDERDFNDIRNDLNLDDETADDAWNSFRLIDPNYALEGEKKDWIACALYTSCRKCVTQTVGKGQRIEGNLVSLTRILRSCELSLVRFFNKMKNWTEMANLTGDMRNKLDQLERNFNVTTVIFKKFKPIFEDIFKCSAQLPCRFMHKNRKHIRKQALNANDIFTFCWTLFVYIKSKYSQISDDLVNSYHLLLVCLDYCFSAVLSFDNYKDIINSIFYDKLARELNSDPRIHNNDNRVSIIDILCNKWNGIAIEAKQIKKHWFKPFLKSLVEKEEIRKRANGIIDNDVIDFNFKYLKNEYETFVLTIGDFDECVFLNETASQELGTAELRPSFSDLDENISSRQANAANQASNYYIPRANNLMPMTPLSSTQYLASRTPVNKAIPLTPITSATSSISRLHSILIGHNDEPSIDLGNLFNKCKVNPREKISNMVKTMGDIFLAAYAKEASPQSLIRSTDEIQYIVADEFPKNRLNCAIKFFYNVLEKILKGELRRNQRIPASQIDEALARIIDRDIFIRSLFACSLEIVLYSYSPYNRMFPWILNIFKDYPNLKIHSFYFYKVIEPIIRDEEGLSREIVKHLNTIEEKILDNLAWTIDSPIWTLMGSKTSAPNYVEATSKLGAQNVDAKIQPSAMTNSSTNRQLTFNDTPVKSEPISETTTKEVDENDNLFVRKTADSDVIKTPVKSDGSKIIKTGQLGLFFRKVYSLASVRLRDLYQRLKINSPEIQGKIWTCFEQCLSAHTILMCDHHLDQLIMCSIFCICILNKSNDRDIYFKDIISSYRYQPQANNQVYRNVLLVCRKFPEFGDSTESLTTSTLSEEATGDIIAFYNQVFIVKVTSAYIKKFSSNEKNSPPLSPMPKSKFSSPMHSPIRRVSNYPVYISPLRPNTCLFPPSPNRSKCKSYHLSNNLNTANQFEELNNSMVKPKDSIGNNAAASSNNMRAQVSTALVMMNGYSAASNSAGARRASKRLLQDEESDGPPPKMNCLSRKLQDIVLDRQIISASSSANVTDDSNDSLPFNRQSGISGLNIASLATTLSPIMGNHNGVAPANFANASTSPHLMVLAEAGINSAT